MNTKSRQNKPSNSKSKSKEDELVVYAPQRPNRIKRFQGVQLLKQDSPIHYPQKQRTKIKDAKKKIKKNCNPFEVLGSEIVRNVEKSMEIFKCLVSESKTSNQAGPFKFSASNFKQFLVKCLMFGKYEIYLEQERDEECNRVLGENDLRFLSQLCFNIQEALFFHYENDVKAYKSRCIMIIDNLKDITNKELRTKVIKGQIDPHKLAVMTQSELDPQERRQANMKKMQYMMAETVLVVSEENKGSQEENTQEDWIGRDSDL